MGCDANEVHADAHESDARLRAQRLIRVPRFRTSDNSNSGEDQHGSKEGEEEESDEEEGDVGWASSGSRSTQGFRQWPVTRFAAQSRGGDVDGYRASNLESTGEEAEDSRFDGGLQADRPITRAIEELIDIRRAGRSCRPDERPGSLRAFMNGPS